MIIRLFLFTFIILININSSILFSMTNYKITDYEKMSIFEYLDLPDDQLNIEIAALILSKEIYPDINFKKYMKLIDQMASDVTLYVGSSSDPETRIASINTTLFRDYGF